MSARNLPIGVFDSGVGGLTVLRAIRETLPGESTLYLGDTARVPYGTKSPATVQRYAREATRLMLERGIKLLVVACNTASAVALEDLREEFLIPIIGVIEPGARAAAVQTRTKQVGVIGTSATVRSRAYDHALRTRDPAITVTSQACPMFVALAEEGWVDDEVAEVTAGRYLSAFAGSGIDTLVLGCTHYPLLTGVIARTMGEGVRVVDSARATASEASWVLDHHDLRAAQAAPVRHSYLVTDSRDRFLELVPRFLGTPLDGNVSEVGIPVESDASREEPRHRDLG